MSPFIVDDWAAGDFSRDTLIFAFGRLAEVVAGEAGRDPQIRRARQQWSAATRPRAAGAANAVAQLLIEAGMDGGSLHLYGRIEEQEFALRCEHAQFCASVDLVFDRRRQRVLGLAVREMKGDALVAARWAMTMTAVLERRHAARDPAARPEAITLN